MKNILIITGSARPSSVNQVIVKQVGEQLAKFQDVTVTIADLVELDMPFFNSVAVPASASDDATPEGVKRWSELVTASDGVVFVAPEYNRSLSAIQKNAIDWLYSEWQGKPTAFVGYGAYAGKHSYESFVSIVEPLKMQLVATMAAVKLGDTVSYEGVVIKQSELDSVLSDTLSELVAATR